MGTVYFNEELIVYFSNILFATNYTLNPTYCPIKLFFEHSKYFWILNFGVYFCLSFVLPDILQQKSFIIFVILCNASVCGADFVFKREKRAQRRSYLKGLHRLEQPNE